MSVPMDRGGGSDGWYVNSSGCAGAMHLQYDPRREGGFHLPDRTEPDPA